MRKVLFIVSLVWLTCSVVTPAKTYHFEYQKNLDVGDKAEIYITNTDGLIEIEGAPVNQITISAVKNVRAVDLEEAEEIADHIEIKVKKSGRKVEVETRFLKIARMSDSFWKKLFGTGPDSFGSVDYKIIVPYNCRTEIDNLEGDIDVSGLDSEVRVSCASGNINLSGIKGGLRIDSMGGRIEIADIVGPLDIRTTSGETEARYIFGDIRGKSTSGDFKIGQGTGNIEIKTHSGDVRIETELDAEGDFFVETSSGEIHFAVPSSVSGSVKLETESGSINTELPLSIKQFAKNKLIGQFGVRGPRIVLRSTTGDITLGQY